MVISTIERERLLAFQAQNAIQEAIREWYAAFKVMGRREPVYGNIAATMLAWSDMAAGLSTRLEMLGATLEAGLASYEQVLPEARACIARVTTDFWPHAHYFANPFATPASPPVEFSGYRYVAALLAQRLAAIAAECLALHSIGYSQALVQPDLDALRQQIPPAELPGLNAGHKVE